MNNEVEVEVRPRPLSTGLWTLFSWLRREDRCESSESLSSAGSDRTVASFAFLPPAKYQPTKTQLILPAPGSPTDSYKRRVLDRNLRRQHERDITLHRKYGLYKSTETTSSYDTFSLPPARRINSETSSRWERERRATSECFQRRIAYVPGKRRAPLPPISTGASPTSLTRRSTRKRRAPQPPVKQIDKIPENKSRDIINHEVNTAFTAQMSLEKQKLSNNDDSMGCRSEKYSKKDGSSKDIKLKSEKSFFKQIFDSRKRNSGTDISSIKILPSISELDKEAAEIIKTCKLNIVEENNNDKNISVENSKSQTSGPKENWICVTCLRKYNYTVINCLYCLSKTKTSLTNPGSNDILSASKISDIYTQTEKNSPRSVTSHKNAAEEKQKLKEMLKEMKDSLPKRTKPGSNIHNSLNNDSVTNLKPDGSYSTETPTLRVGSAIQESNVTTASSTSNVSKSTLPEITHKARGQNPVSMQSTALVQPSPMSSKSYKKDIEQNINITDPVIARTITDIQGIQFKSGIDMEIPERYKDKKLLHTPLKISSLLNPVYVPKNLNSNKPQLAEISETEEQRKKLHEGKNLNAKSIKSTNNNVIKPVATGELNKQATTKAVKTPPEFNKIGSKLKVEIQKSSSNPSRNHPVGVVNDKLRSTTSAVSPIKVQTEIKEGPDHHSRRRDLIHQLEQSIAKGDERAAAEAAAKLAQLRLSCSVLSFSSQILSQPSTSKATMGIETEKIVANHHTKNNMCDKNKQLENKSCAIKERLPQKIVLSNITTSADQVKNNLTSIETPNKSQKIQNAQTKEITAEVKKQEQITSYEMITIAVLVEDKEATRGPVHLLIRRQALMRDLRREAEASLGVATNLQRWIVGRVLCVNDETPVATLAGPNFSAPFYLCVVESEKKSDLLSQIRVSEEQIQNTQIKTGNVYTELVELEQQALVPNMEKFECGVCMEEYLPGLGVVLRECVHIFCKDCLSDVVRHCEEPDIPCPAMGCRGMLQEREIRALVTPQDYERWLARGLAAAESGTRNAFHCRTRDCKGWALCDPGVQRFPCPVCKHINCVPCQAIHDGETCDQHRTKLAQVSATSSANSGCNDDGTRTLLNTLIAKGEALECPECSAIITKKWGCDWVKCSACKTEICWVTRGRRWGPGGKGDTSGGCRCGVDGKRCHPSCGYCH